MKSNTTFTSNRFAANVSISWLPLFLFRLFGQSMRLLFCIYTLLVFTFLPITAGAVTNFTPQENRVALVIGVGSYSVKDYEIENAINDSRAIAAKLTTLGFTVLAEENLRSSELPLVLAKMREILTPGSIVVLYFSGHGMQIEGKNHLLLSDFSTLKTLDDIKRHSLSLDAFVDMAVRGKAQNTFVFLDACRQNPFKDLHTTTGLAEVVAPSGSLIAFSTKPGGFAWDLGGIEDNSLYTKHLIRSIDRPNTPIDQVLKAVNKGVFVESKAAAQSPEDIQEPWLQSSLYDDVFLRQSGPVKTFGNEQADTAFWFRIKDSKTPADFSAYLSNFPNGKFVIPAKSHMSLMESTSERKIEVLPPILNGSRALLLKRLNSPVFLDELENFVKTSHDPMSHLERALADGNLLAKGWWCALSTHERYKFPVRSQEGVKVCSEMVEHGSPIGMYLLGRAHLLGKGVNQSDQIALKLFQRAASTGNATAQNILGDMYSAGRGVSKSPKTAFSWYLKSGTAGNPDAQNNLGIAYGQGVGVSQDLARSIMWYQRAADLGHAWAQSNLGAMLLLGKGTSPDYQKALALITQSAQQGNAQAWLFLGTIYATGAGVEPSPATARKWYQRTVDQASDPELKRAAADALARLEASR